MNTERRERRKEVMTFADQVCATFNGNVTMAKGGTVAICDYCTVSVIADSYRVEFDCGAEGYGDTVQKAYEAANSDRHDRYYEEDATIGEWERRSNEEEWDNMDNGEESEP
jgi:hypothetical protein